MFRFRFILTLILFVLITLIWAVNYWQFGPLSHPSKEQIHVAKDLTLFDRNYPLAFHTLATTGEPSPDGNGATFAAIIDRNGKPIEDYEKGLTSPYICHNGAGPDHTSLLQKGDALFSITHLECSIGGAYITALQQSPDGLLLPQSFHAVDFSAVNGTAVGCAGSTTPWQTHLGSEEYENNMAEAIIEMPSIAGILRYNGWESTPEMIQKAGYSQGWITEINPLSATKAEVSKHYSMGRFSHELAYVMPDQKTVYMSDDGTNGVLFMFIADKVQDLSSGTLYAAKWLPTQEQNSLAELEWIALGHATDTEIQTYLNGRPAFDELFDKRPYRKGCNAPYRAVNTATTHPECLKLKPGMERIASRLESRRYAAYLGATSELKKNEGLTFDSQNNRLYLAVSVVSSGMEDRKKKGKPDARYDEGTSNDIRLPYNPCGMVLSLSMHQDKKLGSSYVAKTVSTLIAGKPQSYAKTDPNRYNSCDVTTVANPDNLSMLPGSPYLSIAEDSKEHERDRLWILNTQNGQLQELAQAPFGAEFTSAYWHRDIDGYSYLFTVIQHPYGEADRLIDHRNDTVPEEAKHSVVGYFGPFRF